MMGRIQRDWRHLANTIKYYALTTVDCCFVLLHTYFAQCVKIQ